MSRATSLSTPGVVPDGAATHESILGLVAEDLVAVEQVFADQLASEIPIIRDMGRHILGSGGKRLRPALHLIAAKAVGCDDPRRVVLASVFELIHTATLVHDDVIDEATTRRGQTSLNALRGNTITVLMGDYLYLKSVILTLQNEDLEILRLISSITAKMIEGEMMQVVKNGDLEISQSEYEDIVRRKTAYLFAVCCQTAGMLGGASPAHGQALYEFGLNLGMEFQLVDDVLDFVAEADVLGKPVLSDFREGKVTMPLIHLLKVMSPADRRRLDPVLASVLEEDAGEVGDARREIARLVVEHGGIDATRKRAREYADRARDALVGLPSNEALEALRALPEYVLYREK